MPRRSPGYFRALPAADQQDATNATSATNPGLRSSTTPAPDQSKVTCFNYSKAGHFASSCLNPRTTPRIHKIQQDTNASGDKANDKDNADSKSEN
jgi:hypothetical protein